MMMWWLAQDAGGGDVYLVWGFVLLAAAVALVCLELFVPSGGLIGMLAGVASVGSIISFFKYDTTWGFVAAALYVILTPIVAVFGFKVWLHSPLAKRMILGGIEDHDDPDTPTTSRSEQVRRERLEQLRQLIGATGTSITPLRPVGTVRIDGQRLEAMAEGDVIDAGVSVVVTDVYDNQIKVRPA